MLKEKQKSNQLNAVQRWFLKHKILKLESKYNAYLKLKEPSDKGFSFGKEKRELEYNRSLLMPYFQQDVVEAIAQKRVAPKVINNLKLKKHAFGEEKEKDFRYRMALLEVTEDVCRINNWTKRSDWVEKKVPVNRLFKDLMISAVDYSDILKFYAKLRFDERQRNAKGF